MFLFIVPDDPEEPLEESSIQGEGNAEAEEGEDLQLKAQLDDTEASRATQKVDLDLDDAPFLDEEEEEEEVLEDLPVEEPDAIPEVEAPARKKGSGLLKNKFLWVGLGAGVLIGGLLFFILGPSSPPPPPPPPQPEETKTEVEEIVPEPGENLVKLDPFLVEQVDAEGTIRFLEVTLVFSTTDAHLADNLTRETPMVRYALFYYMKSKELSFLTDQTKKDQLVKELLSVVNQYMSAGQFETLYFEQLLVK